MATRARTTIESGVRVDTLTLHETVTHDDLDRLVGFLAERGASVEDSPAHYTFRRRVGWHEVDPESGREWFRVVAEGGRLDDPLDVVRRRPW